jgi:hypothetical protein
VNPELPFCDGVPLPILPEVVVELPLPVVVVTVVAGTQLEEVNTSSSKVTAPFRASALPCTVTPLVTVIDVRAKIFPAKTEFVPSVAELPTCQKTLQA